MKPLAIAGGFFYFAGKMDGKSPDVFAVEGCSSGEAMLTLVQPHLLTDPCEIYQPFSSNPIHPAANGPILEQELDIIARH